MPKIEMSGRLATCASVVALAGAGLTACGGSSGSASHNGSSVARTPTSSTAASPSTSSPTSSSGASSATARSQAERLGHSKVSGGRAPAVTAQQTAFRHALGNFSTCLRQHGVNIPRPNTSGNGPALSTKGIDTRTPQYRAAVTKCRGVLIGAFRQAARSAGRR